MSTCEHITGSQILLRTVNEKKNSQLILHLYILFSYCTVQGEEILKISSRCSRLLFSYTLNKPLSLSLYPLQPAYQIFKSLEMSFDLFFFVYLSKNTWIHVKKKIFIGFCAALWKTQLSSNNLKGLFSVWLYQSLWSLWGDFGPLFFITLLHFIQLCEHLFMHCSLKIQPQHFNEVDVWTSVLVSLLGKKKKRNILYITHYFS